MTSLIGLLLIAILVALVAIMLEVFWISIRFKDLYELYRESMQAVDVGRIRFLIEEELKRQKTEREEG